MAVIPPSNTGNKPSDLSPVDDYVNASYVQPLGTRKRYIATQGPLPATFVDFWT
jgi:protein tyrosine phosphatase